MSYRVGLVGYCCATGLGIAAREFYEQLPFARWLMIEHPWLGVEHSRLDESCHLIRTRETSYPEIYIEVKRLIAGLDAIFAIERGYIPGLWFAAKSMGIRTILMPNIEWFRPEDPEMTMIDLFIAPTLSCAEMLKREGLGQRTLYIPYPVNVEKFAFRCRERAESFIHCRGWGGYKGRKGTDIVLEAAKRCAEVRFVIRAQKPLEETCSGNVQLLGPTATPEEQYNMGDVAIQPSRWEGVGLQILEAMSCGLPTIVPDAPPMNEYPADEVLLVPATGCLVDIEGKTWTAWETDVEALVQRIRQIHQQPISNLSRRAAAQMEWRSWQRLKGAYMQALGM
jgi:glycosyltransferase involved in cell wall biosynthesis